MGRIGDNAQFPDSGVWNVRDAFKNPVDPVQNLLQNAALWLDAADLATITQSGGDVSQWNNKGTLGNFTQGSGALQPKTGVGTLNGRNVLDFSSDLLTAVNTNEWKFLHDGTDYIFALVCKITNVANQQQFLGNIGAATTPGVGIENRATGQLAHIVATNSANASVVNLSTNNQFVNNTYLVFTGFGDPDNGTAADRSEVYKNAGSAIKNNVTTNAASTSNPTDALRIGQSASGASPLVGSIAEIVIVSGADATEGNRVIIRDYLNAKWGVY